MKHTTTDPVWGDVATAAAITLLLLSLVAIVVVVIVEHRRTRVRRNDPLGIADAVGVLRDHTARLNANGGRR